MLPDRVSNPGPLTYEPGAPPIVLRGPAKLLEDFLLSAIYSENYTLVCSMIKLVQCIDLA